MKKNYILAMPVTRHALALGKSRPSQLSGHAVGWAYKELKLPVEPLVGDFIPREGEHKPNGMFLVQQRIYPHSKTAVARAASLVVVCVPFGQAEEPVPQPGENRKFLPPLVVTSEHVWGPDQEHYGWKQLTHENRLLIGLGDLLTEAYRGTQILERNL